MQTREFLSLLKENPNKNLLFEYKNGQIIGANYHITEVKHISIDSVDCGANTNSWKETVIQLWESPLEKEKREYMSTYKAMSILNKVDRTKPMEKEGELKFEYSNPSFHTAQLVVNDYAIDDENLLIKLSVEKTNCKAKETCGTSVAINEPTETCCAPVGGCC